MMIVSSVYVEYVRPGQTTTSTEVLYGGGEVVYSGGVASYTGNHGYNIAAAIPAAQRREVRL